MQTGKALYGMGMARNMEIAPGDAVDVRDTKMLSGLAMDTIDYTEDNDTQEYVTGKPNYGSDTTTGRN